MKNENIKFRTIVILAVLALSIYSLLPSWKVHSLSGEEKEAFKKANPEEVKKAVNFGLDLAGGTHVVVEVDTKGLKEEDKVDALDRSLEIVRNRVDQFGVSEPIIAKSGENRIVADLAGVNAENARKLIGSTAKLEFKLVSSQEKFLPVLNRIDAHLQAKTANLTATTVDSTKKEDIPDAGLLGGVTEIAELTDDSKAVINKDTLPSASGDSIAAASVVAESTKEEVNTSTSEGLQSFKDRPFASRLIRLGNDLGVLEGDVESIKTILAEKPIQALIPHDLQLTFGMGLETLQDGRKAKRFFALKRRAEMDGEEITDAKVQRTQTGDVSVDLKFGGLGPKKFSMVTGNNIQRQLAIVLDGQVVSAPVIQARISTGNAQITGLEDYEEARQLAVVLRAGALPAPMEIIEMRSVGATLGQENINSGMYAALIGFALVIVFMVFYYAGSGVNAVVALIFNVLIIGAIMSMFHATLTLPGIAGIILTIGMAVDANVIIFERIREEIRAGRTARTAIEAGFDKAFSTIFDANVTTFLTAMILYNIGAGPIKGFGLTLMIGILASMFTALYVTRYLYIIKGISDSNKLSIGSGVKAINDPKLPFIPNRKPFVSISVLLVIASLTLVFTKGLNYGIDFTGGNLLTLNFEGDVNESDIKAALKDFESPRVQTSTATTGDLHFLVSIEKQGKGSSVKESVVDALNAASLKHEILNEEMVGPSIGAELKKDALVAILWALAIIIAYIWARFGKIGFGFGLASVLALSHDVIITLGIIALFGLQVDAAIIAALLTIVGYSLNDTIVVFDRIRENTLTGRGDYATKVNESINQSLSRTFITSFTTLFVIVALVSMGGIAVKDFAWAMLIGVVVGTYSSMFVASPFVVWWQSRKPTKIGEV
jgi:SecD/SecF fusion protein